MKNIAVILLVTFVTLVGKPVYAQSLTDDEWDYVEIIQGKSAPFSGYLFSYEGITNALVRVQQKNKLLEIKKDEELERVKAALQAEINISNSKLNATVEMHQEQIRIKNEAIDAFAKKAEFSRLRMYGGIAVGFLSGLVTAGIIYQINKQQYNK